MTTTRRIKSGFFTWLFGLLFIGTLAWIFSDKIVSIIWNVQREYIAYMVSVDYELHVSMFLVFTVAAVCATMLLVLMFANKNVVLSVVSVVLLTAILAAVGNEVIYVKAMFDGLTQEVVSCRGLPLDEIFIFPVEAPVAPADEAPATVAPAPEAPAVVAPVIPTVTPAAPQQPAATATAPADANGAGKMELQSDGTFKFVPAGK